MNPLKFNKIRSFCNSYGFWGALRDAEDYIEKYKNNIAYLDVECIKANDQSHSVILKMWWED